MQLAIHSIGPRLLNPIAQRRRGEVELARHGRDALAFVEH
jgi:hypothetical protein